ncbi:hypothetical protein [Haloarchaeobius baliensis]|uniref:hypothetical protein n=1 Tax=Haloarchaeobius baliensis TaxID=1670458 RepID=UPI003F881DBC
MIRSPEDDTGATTRIDCELTEGYNVKPGIHVYEYCPFCGHPAIEGEGHEISIALPS